MIQSAQPFGHYPPLSSTPTMAKSTLRWLKSLKWWLKSTAVIHRTYLKSTHVGG